MRRLLLTLIGTAMLSACAPEGPQVILTGPDDETVRVDIEIADDTLELQKGLMDRTELPEGAGMLFVFKEEQTLMFWMKNTLIPLDILYFNAKGEFVSGTTMTPCEKDPCPLYPSDGPAQYALEVPKGFANTHQITKGWTVSEVKYP
jgi:uncharacterized membrane protein (UPF0127 family)